MKKDKIFTIILIVAIAILLIISIFVGSDKADSATSNSVSNDAETILANAQKESSAVKDSEKGDFVQINVDKYLEYYAGNENKIVLIARPTCHYCQIAEPILQKIIKEKNIEINYLNTDEFSGDDQEKLVNSDKAFKNGFGTPFLMIVSNNSIVDSVDGVTDTAHYIGFFKKNNFIS